MAKENHFAVLGLKPGASDEEIKQAYRSLAKAFHPDKNNDAKAEEKFKRISASYEFLKSKDRKEMHERELLQKDRNRQRETNVRDFERERRKQKNREKQGLQKQRGEKYGNQKQRRESYNPFGEFKSYDEEFRIFFSEKDPFRKRDPNEIINEFMGHIPMGNIEVGMSFGDIDRMMNNFRPFKTDNKVNNYQERNDDPPRDRRHIEEETRVQFKTPSADFSSFYDGGGKEAAFKDLYT